MRYAEIVANHFGAEFHKILIDPDISSLLPNTIWHLEEPVADPAAINTYLIVSVAQKDVKALLSGQGADEIFGGYRVHQVDFFARRLSLLPRWSRERILRKILAILPSLSFLPGVHKGLMMAIRRYFSGILDVTDMSSVQRYLSCRSYYSTEILQNLIQPELYKTIKHCNPLQNHENYCAEVSDADFINQMLYVDIKTFLPELNLTYADKRAMAASVETRVPFLDNEVVEFMSRIEPQQKIKGMTGKFVLRKAVADIVPKEIIKRRKAGFGAPIRKWLDSDLIEMTDDLLSRERVEARKLFNPGVVHKMLKDHYSGLQDNTYRIWALMTLEIWMQQYIDSSKQSITVKHSELKLQ